MCVCVCGGGGGGGGGGQWQTPSTGLRHPALEEGARKRCWEGGGGAMDN